MREPEAGRKTRFASVLRRARERRGLTPPQLALRLGVSRWAIHRWENPAEGDAPSILFLKPLCNVLRLDPAEFIILPGEAVEPHRATPARMKRPAEQIVRRAGRDPGPFERSVSLPLAARERVTRILGD